MRLSTSPPAASECLGYARQRYRNRPLLCAVPRARVGGPQHLLSAGSLDVASSREVAPGTVLLLQVRDTEEGSTQTLLARVASADRRADGSWLVRCRFAGTPGRVEAV